MINTSEETFMGWPIKGEGIPDGFQRCPDCGELVGAGLLPRIKHWGDCGGKGLVDAMRSMAEEKKSFTIEDFNIIAREEDLKNRNR